MTTPKREALPEAWAATARSFASQQQVCAVLGAPLGDSPILFPGSFNPLHAGHQAMAAMARQRLQRAVHFEISVANVDKPDLGASDLLQRLQQFTDGNVVLTRAARFTEKAELFPHAYFVVGADTLARMVSPRYYGSEAAMRTAIERLSQQVAGVLVFGRAAMRRRLFDADAGDSHDSQVSEAEPSSRQFLGVSTIQVPQALRDKCIEVTEAEFRMDLSSSELRRREQLDR